MIFELIEPFSSAWEIHYKSLDYVGADMAEFALGSLATMAERNPMVVKNGAMPWLGSRVKPDWKTAKALCASIASLHLVLLGLAFYFTKDLHIPPDSGLAMAQVWRPLLEKTGMSSLSSIRASEIGLMTLCR